MNEQNLIPNSERTPSELREITRKGGVKSGETRRRNRDIKKIVAALLHAAPDDLGTVNRLKAMGIDDQDITNKTALVLSMFDEATKGNVKAFETLMKYSGEDPEQQRKDLELQMKRDAHILALNDKHYYGFSLDVMGDREKQYALNNVTRKYKELKDAQDDYLREEIEANRYDDDDEYEDEDED